MFVLGSKEEDFESMWMLRCGVRRRWRKQKVASLKSAANFTTLIGEIMQLEGTEMTELLCWCLLRKNDISWKQTSKKQREMWVPRQTKEQSIWRLSMEQCKKKKKNLSRKGLSAGKGRHENVISKSQESLTAWDELMPSCYFEFSRIFHFYSILCRKSVYNNFHVALAKTLI